MHGNATQEPTNFLVIYHLFNYFMAGNQEVILLPSNGYQIIITQKSVLNI